MSKMKKLFISLFIILTAFTLVSCKGKEEGYKYPAEVPAITSPEALFLSYDGIQITNQQAYLKLVNQYGYEEILNWIDETFFYADKLGNQNDTEFEKYLNLQMYGVETISELSKKEKAELDETWKKAMTNNGFASEADWKNYYKLQYLRQQEARTGVVSLISEFDKLVAELNSIDFNLYVTENQTLKVKGTSNEKIEIAWTSNNAYVEIDEETAVVTRGNYDSEVTLTATATLDDLSTTATYKFTVPAKTTTVTDTSSKAEKEVVEYFTTAEYEAYLESNYQGSVETALVFFDSEREARSALKAAGVDLATLKGQAWSKDGIELTEAQVKEVFVKLYKSTNGIVEDESTPEADKVTFDKIAKTYSYKELSELNASICSKVYALASLSNLQEEETLHDTYTIMPVAYGTKFFLALNVEEEALPELDSKKAEIKEELIDGEVTSKYITYSQLNKILTSGTLEVFHEGLENKLVASIASTYSAVSKEAPEYTRTTGTNKTNILTYKVGDKTESLTADMLFARLVKRYGANLVLSYVNTYSVLKYSEIMDYKTGEAKEGQQEKYDAIFASVVTTVRNAFDAGEYATAGYPAVYGWENFLKDNLGVTEEKQLLYTTSTEIYTKALDKYELALLNGTELKEQALAKAEEAFKVTAYSISAYIDANNDANPDTMVPEVLDSEDAQDFYKLSAEEFWTKHGEKYAAFGATKEEFASVKTALTASYALQVKFINKMYSLVELSYGIGKATATKEELAIAAAIAVDNEETLARVNQLKTLYAIAELTDTVFGEFKVANLQLSVSSSSTYSNTSSISAEYKDQLKALYDQIVNNQTRFETYEKDGKLVVDYKHADITGKDLDPFYAYSVTSAKTGEKVNFVEGPKVSDAFFNVDRVTKVIVTQATDKAYLDKTTTENTDADGNVTSVSVVYSYTKEKDFELTITNYFSYLKDQDDDEDSKSDLSTKEKSVISSYYVVAVDEYIAEQTDAKTNALIAAIGGTSLQLNENVNTSNLKDILTASLSE